MTFKTLDAFREFEFNTPEITQNIQKFEHSSGVVLPYHYVEFLLQSDGGEGFIGPDNYLILWKLSELAELNTAYDVKTFAPGFLLIGSNGGGEAIAIETHLDAQSIFILPFVGMEKAAAKSVAPDFNAFMMKLTHEGLFD